MEHERFNRRKKTYIVLGLLAVWLVWISGVFGNSGMIQAYQLSQVKKEMTLRVAALENEKARLWNTLHALENDPFVQEQAIRESLGFVHAQELVFEFREN